MPQITIIVPVYKVEAYLSRCVDSILAQTFRDFELILVDDGSPDNCGAICDAYAEKDSRIHVIHQPNGGLSAARNAGIDWAFANSDSEWIGFVDSDDWIHPRMYETLHRIATEQGTKLAICDFLRTETMQPIEPVQGDVTTHDGLAFLCSDRNVQAVVAWNKLYRKELFDTFRYPVGKVHEDEYLAHHLLYRAGRIAYIDCPLYYYFQNDESIMQRPYTVKRLDAVGAAEDQFQFIKSKGKPEYLPRIKQKLFHVYADNYRELMKIGEKERALRIRQKTRAFVRKECREYLDDLEKYGYELYPFFPHLVRSYERRAHFRKLMRGNNWISVIKHYFHKAKEH